MQHSGLHTISDTALSLGVSEDLVKKFIKKGLITPIKDATTLKLTSYGIRRLSRILELYEDSYSIEIIEKQLNDSASPF